MDILELHSNRQTQLLCFYAHTQMKLKFQLEEQKKSLTGYKHQAHYWEAQFKQIKEREEAKNTEIAALKAQLKKREHQLFGGKSEKSSSKSESKRPKVPDPKKKRGQQRGNPGPKRRDYSHLPGTDETIDLLDNEKHCPCCCLPYTELPGTEDSTLIEVINVRAYQRRIHRKIYKPSCQCPSTPQIITAPTPSKLIPKCRFGISVWAHLLIQKFKYQRPAHNSLNELSNHGLNLAPGTIADGFKVLMSRYLTPIYDLIQKRSLSAKHWHADETRWKVFEKLDGTIQNLVISFKGF